MDNYYNIGINVYHNGKVHQKNLRKVFKHHNITIIKLLK